MTRPDDRTRKPEDETGCEIPADLRAVDALLSEALAEWARSDAARTGRIHRATAGSLGVPAAPRRPAKVASAAGWRWALYVGGGLAAAAMVTLVLRSGSEDPAPVPAKAPVEIVEGPSSDSDGVDRGAELPARPSAAEPVLVALIERDASRWSEDWTDDDSYGHSSAWAEVVPVLETRDAGFDTVAGEIGEILVGSIGGSGTSGGSLR